MNEPLELFVVYKSGPLEWTAELLRLTVGAYQWVTVFRVSVPHRDKLEHLWQLWPHVCHVEL